MRKTEYDMLRRSGRRITLGEASGGPKVVSKVALYSEDGRLCMGPRNDSGAYTYPGGHAEAGETPLEAAVREVEEETGISLDPDDVEHVGSENVRTEEGDPLTVHVFRANVDSTRTSTKEDPDAEVTRWEWLEVDDGLPSHVLANLHVPKERDVVSQTLGLLSQSDVTEDVDTQSDTQSAPDPQTGGNADGVKKLHKMADKVFKGIDDMAIFANEVGLSDMANMIGKVEDAFWEFKRALAKKRE